MAERYAHRRETDMDMYAHSREREGLDQDIPRWLHWAFISINRVGFPVVAFFFMWHIADDNNKKVNAVVEAMNKQSLALQTLITTVNMNHDDTKAWRTQMLEAMHDVRARLR